MRDLVVALGGGGGAGVLLPHLTDALRATDPATPQAALLAAWLVVGAAAPDVPAPAPTSPAALAAPPKVWVTAIRSVFLVDATRAAVATALYTTASLSLATAPRPTSSRRLALIPVGAGSVTVSAAFPVKSCASRKR